MFSGLIRWFEQHVLPAVSTDVQTFAQPLLLDIESAGGAALTAAVQTAVTQAAGLTSGGAVDAGKVLQAGIDAGKALLATKGLSDLEHAAVGVAAAAVANLHATASVTPPTGVAATVAQVNPSLVPAPAS